MKTITLNGAWAFARRGGTPMTAVVPGCNYQDLLRAGAIEDPFYGENERKSLWVGESDFDYWRTFTLEADDLATDRVLLSCAMLDTLCRIYVNDILVGEGRNSHIGYAFDVTGAIHAGENKLRIEFDSPLRYAKSMADKHKTPPDISFKGRTHIRKAQCHFGWDWGPCIPVSGITGDISLKLYKAARLLPPVITQRHTDGKARLCVQAQAEAYHPGVELRTSLLSPDGDVIGQGNEKFETVIEKPQLWWTRDLGEQPLYTLRVEAMLGDEAVDIVALGDYYGIRGTHATAALKAGKHIFADKPL